MNWLEYGPNDRRFFSKSQKRYVPPTPEPVATPEPPPPPPKEEDPEVQQVAAETIRRKKSARGFRSTILGSLVARGQQAQGSTTQPGSQTTFGA